MPDPSSRSAQVVVLMVLLVAAGAFWKGWSDRAVHAERLRLEAAVGAVPIFVDAPDVHLLNRDGPVRLSSYEGRVGFVNFWATWCGACIAEMPSLIRLKQSLDPADIAFVSIAEDDSWPPLDAYLKSNPLPFDIYRDQPPRIEIQFETGSYPTSFLIDSEGEVLYRFNGGKNWDTDEVRALLALEGVGPAR